MAKSTKKKLRAAWLSVHKWIGLALAILIIPLSLTGSALVWSDSIEAKLEPQRHAIIAPVQLPPSAYAKAATRLLAPGETITALRFDSEGAPVVASAMAPAKGSSRPARTTLWLDPRDARLIDLSSGNQGVLQVMHVLHGSLMIPIWGRTIVGWVGVFMFVSCISGLWLWWPLSGGWRTGFRWKRRNTLNANLHYLTGFWVLIPLAMLSLTGAWISFPKLFGQFESRPPAAQANREAAARAKPLSDTVTSVDDAVATAGRFATGPLVMVTWPTDQKPSWKVSFAGKQGNSDVMVDDASAKVSPPSPPAPETLARTMRRWHDGTGMGLGWQVLIFLGGIIPAILSVTGIIIWWRSSSSRKKRPYPSPLPRTAVS